MSYYIEASDRQFQETRRQEFTPAVVPQPGMCADPKMLAGALSAASVIVGGPPGAAAVPIGFSGAGVTSASAAGTAGVAAGAGGGVGVGTIAVVGAGVAAVGAAVAVSQGGDSAPTTTRPGASAPPTTTTLPAGPVCPACYAGTWQAVATIAPISPPLPCGEPESPIGQPTTVAPIVFSPDGTIVLPQQDCAGCAGRVDAQGNFTITTPGDAAGCPAGQISGRCTSTSSCPGTGAQGGVSYTFVMSRVGP